MRKRASNGLLEASKALNMVKCRPETSFVKKTGSHVPHICDLFWAPATVTPVYCQPPPLVLLERRPYHKG
jgi:hypothetical protein